MLNSFSKFFHSRKSCHSLLISNHNVNCFFRFPRLQTLIWDWNVVDPELNFDDRTKNILKQLLDVNQRLNLGALAVVAYTPNPETKASIEGVARTLKESIKEVQLHQFATKGLSDGMANFSLIVAGKNEKVLKELVEMYVVDRSTIPPMG